MTARKMIIYDCEDCPKLDHKGAFGKVYRIPACRKANKELPWEPAVSERTINIYARRIPEIPKWCPLPKDES